MESILITGATGMIGSALTELLLKEGYAVIGLTRDPGKQVSRHPHLRYAGWDPQKGRIDDWAISEADHVINLAGASVAEGRWTNQRKQVILQSRVQSGHTLTQALAKVPNKVLTVLQASAIGWYGADPKRNGFHAFKEDAPADRHFLGSTCQQWEESIAGVRDLGKRLVYFRIGIVLSNRGGAYREFLKPVTFGIAPVLGSGRQIYSWIHITDLCYMFLYAVRNKELNGVFNAVTPYPISNRELILGIARQRNSWRYISIPVPSWVLQGMLGEMSIEVLKSSTVSGEKIMRSGFVFTHPEIHEAIRSLITDPTQ
jgi:uncharacterized protein (TIGR01777 family)